MYNIRADPDLSFGNAEIRRIPCECNICVEQLNKTWVSGKLSARAGYVQD